MKPVRTCHLLAGCILLALVATPFAAAAAAQSDSFTSDANSSAHRSRSAQSSPGLEAARPRQEADEGEVIAARSDADAHEALDQELSLKVGKHMRQDDYPDEARRQRWTGTVLIEVLIARDGLIKQVELAKTSGFAVLDERALDVVRRVPKLFVPAQLRGGEQRARVPIGFYLQD